MKSTTNNKRHFNKTQNKISKKKIANHPKKMLSDDGFKTGNKSHGYTWEVPMDEQGFVRESLSKDKAGDKND